MHAAAKDMAEHVIEHNELTLTLLKGAAERWLSEVEAWEFDQTVPNPYEITVAGVMHYFLLRCQLTTDYMFYCYQGQPKQQS